MGQMELVFANAPGFATRTQAVIAAAQAGDWAPADALEMEFLNNPANGVFPGHLGPCPEQYQGAKAYAIERSDAGLRVLWVAPEYTDDKLVACRHPDAVGNLRDNCFLCDGTGWHSAQGESVALITTDIDGRILDAEADGSDDWLAAYLK